MINKRGQANFIVSLGMVIATAFVLLSGFSYIHNVGLSSSIEITAQSSIYQTLSAKSYILQQVNYNFQKAQTIVGLNLAPASTTCGYINTQNITPFIPIPSIYYWHNAAGQTCLPDNAQIVLGLEELLNETKFAMVNSSGSQDITSVLNLNLSTVKNGIFYGNFSAPFLNNSYLLSYNRSSQNYTVCEHSSSSCTSVFSGVAGQNFLMGGKKFAFAGEQDLVSGVLSHPSAVNSFFSGSHISPSSQYVVVTFPNGDEAIVYSNETNGIYSFEMTPIINQNVYTLKGAMSEDTAAGITPQIQLSNNTAFTFDGTDYNFVISSDVTGFFTIAPVNYAVVSLQPQFVFYKYILSSFEVASNENLLFPNNKNLYVSFSAFPLYNPEICLSYNEVQFNLENCLSLSGYVSNTNYLSTLLSLSTAFVNETFPLGSSSIRGFAQYEIDNYISNVIGGVNLKSVSVNGQPKYDWYSSLILAMGSPQGTNYLLNELSRVKEPYYGTYIYNCSQNSSDLQFCRQLLSQTLSGNIQDLLDKEIPMELSFLSGSAFDVNVLNLSINTSESSLCTNYKNYKASANYSFSSRGPVIDNNYSEEVLGIPISLDFGYQNNLSLTPTELCGIQNSPYTTGYPGFDLALVANTTYLNCAPIVAKPFINTTCIAGLETTNRTTEQYISSNSGAPSGEGCTSVNQSGSIYYYCPYYKTQEFSYQNWITSGNSCPSSLLVDNENFTTQGNTYNGKLYKLLSIYGGGVKSSGPYGTYNNWTFALLNGSLTLPENLSINAGVELGGPSPSFSILLSKNQNLQSQFTAVKLSSETGGFNGIYNYSVNSGLSVLSQSASNAASKQQENIEVNRFCTAPASCNLTFEVNGVNQSYYSSSDLQLLSGGQINLIGASTGSKTSSDLLNYFFISNYIPDYNAISSESQSFPASTLNPSLNSSFGLPSDQNTYYNQILINNPVNLSYAYQGKLVLNNNFNLTALSSNGLKVFAVYPNRVSELYWWNQTPIANGATIWVNLTKELPSSLYVVYGSEVGSSNPYSSNGTEVFPFFFYPTQSSGKFNFVYPSKQHEYAPAYSSAGLNLTNIEPQPPYIYNATLSKYYAQFACISIKPSFELTLLNATYSPYPPAFNLATMYNGYDPIYPNLTIIGVNKYNSWP